MPYIAPSTAKLLVGIESYPVWYIPVSEAIDYGV